MYVQHSRPNRTSLVGDQRRSRSLSKIKTSMTRQLTTFVTPPIRSLISPTWSSSYQHGWTATTGTRQRRNYRHCDVPGWNEGLLGVNVRSDRNHRSVPRSRQVHFAQIGHVRTLFMFGQEGKTMAEELRFRDAVTKSCCLSFQRTKRSPALSLCSERPITPCGRASSNMWLRTDRNFECVGLTSSIATAVLITLSVAMIDADLLLIAYLAGIRKQHFVQLSRHGLRSCRRLLRSSGSCLWSRCPRRGFGQQGGSSKAITRMGGSIIQGGMTTLLGGGSCCCKLGCLPCLFYVRV